MTVVTAGATGTRTAEPQDAVPDAALLLDLDLLKDVDLTKDRDLLRKLRILERMRVLESWRLLESQPARQQPLPATPAPREAK